MNGVYTLASGSTSSLYGNVGCAIKELILRKFPYNFFKYTNVSTEVAFRNIRRNFGSNHSTEIVKRLKPYLVIQPTYQVPDPDSFLQNVPLTKNDMDIQYRLDPRYLFDVVIDKENKYNLKFKLNRDRIDYDVTITVATLHQQLDLYKSMVNQITWDRALYECAALESVIPRSIINYMGYLSNIDIVNYPDQIPTLMRTINHNAAYPINYKLRNSSATDEFFMYYTHNLVVAFTDLTLDAPSKKNMMDDFYQITFRVSAEFNLPGLYVLSGDEKRLQELRVNIKDTTIRADGNNDDEYIPLYTLTNLYNRYSFQKDGLTLYTSTIFHTEKNVINDTLEFLNLFDSEYIQAIKSQISYGNLPETVCKLYVIENNEEKTNDEYSIDWNSFKLTIMKSNHSATYRLLIYINANKINEILINLKDVNSTERSMLRDNIIDYTNIKTPEIFDDRMIVSDQVSDIDTTSVDQTENDLPDTETDHDKVIMKYSSSIFDTDNPISIKVEESSISDGKKKYSSSKSNKDNPPRITYHDIPDKCILNAIDVWSKIVSSALLYNYASAIGLEKDNNYHLKSNVDI